MDTFETIALFLLSGIVAAGVSLPLNRYSAKPLFWIFGILIACAYSALVSKQCCVTPDFKFGYTRAFEAIPLFVYFNNGIIALLYVFTALFCSRVYEKERRHNKNFQKNLFLNRWFGLIAGGFLAALLYGITPAENCGIFFSTVAGMVFPIFALSFGFVIPFGLLIRQNE